MTEALAGKTALITGAAKRVGAALARACAEAGMPLILHYRRSGAEAARLRDGLSDTGVPVHLLQADFSEAGAGAALMERALDAAGVVDVLINNAGIFPESTLRDFSAEALVENVQVNALAPLELCRAFAAQEKPGAILNFLDTMIRDYDRKHAAYHLSKRMLYSLTRMMAVEFAPAIRVNAIAPGLILPPEGKDESYLRGLSHSNPLKTWGGPGDVCDAALFLLRARFVTGQVIYVDGGRHLRGSMYE
jgi:pteridine reductase